MDINRSRRHNRKVSTVGKLHGLRRRRQRTHSQAYYMLKEVDGTIQRVPATIDNRRLSMYNKRFNYDRIHESLVVLNEATKISVTEKDIYKVNKKLMQSTDSEIEEMYNRNRIDLYGKEYSLLLPDDTLIRKLIKQDFL